jgi:hypothetical protein
VRAALISLALLLAVPAGARAEPAFLRPDARVFTLAGGGSEVPRDGVRAAQADLGPGRMRGLAALPDGSVAVLTGDALAVRIGLDGRLRVLPRVPPGANGLSAGPDGSLYTVTFKQLLRLTPGGTGWTEAMSLAQLRGRPGLVEVRSFAALADGFAFAFGNGSVLRVGADGVAREVPVPDGLLPTHVFARADGGFAYAAVDDFVQTEERIVVVPPSGPPRTLEAVGRPSLDLVADADGSYLRTGSPLDLLDAEGRRVARVGWRPGLGLGDGGPPARALLGDAGGLALSADGTLVVEDIVASERAPIDAFAGRPPGGTLVTERPEGFDAAMVLRILVPPAVARPLAAFASSTFSTLATGRVGYVTTFPRPATVEVRARGRVVTRAEADVDAGEGELVLPALPPRGDLRLSLTVDGAAGAAAAARLAVTTARRLTFRRAQRLVGGPAGGFRAGRCVRRSARRIACRALTDERTASGGVRRRCAAVIVVRLRPDGARATLSRHSFRHQRRACRRLTR